MGQLLKFIEYIFCTLSSLWNLIITGFSSISSNILFTPILNFLNIVILALTAIFGFNAARQASYTNELSLLPLLAIYFRKIKDKERPFAFYVIRIKNVGNGVAYNINVHPLILFLHDIHTYWTIYFQIQDTNVIAPGKERTLETRSYAREKRATLEDIITNFLKSGDKKNKPIYIPITFKNAKGDDYYCIAECGQDTVLIKSPSKRISLLDRVYLLWLVVYDQILIWKATILWKIIKTHNRK